MFIGVVALVLSGVTLCCTGHPPQVRTLASAGGPDNLVMLDPGKYKAKPRSYELTGDGTAAQMKWQVGEQEFEALMRMLDNLVGGGGCLEKIQLLVLFQLKVSCYFVRRMGVVARCVRTLRP